MKSDYAPLLRGPTRPGRPGMTDPVTSLSSPALVPGHWPPCCPRKSSCSLTAGPLPIQAVSPLLSCGHSGPQQSACPPCKSRASCHTCLQLPVSSRQALYRHLKKHVHGSAHWATAPVRSGCQPQEGQLGPGAVPQGLEQCWRPPCSRCLMRAW